MGREGKKDIGELEATYHTTKNEKLAKIAKKRRIAEDTSRKVSKKLASDLKALKEKREVHSMQGKEAHIVLDMIFPAMAKTGMTAEMLQKVVGIRGREELDGFELAVLSGAG